MVKRFAIVVIIFFIGSTAFAGTPQKWADLPQAVRDTVIANGGTSGMSVDLEPKKIDGKRVYEAEIKGKDGKIIDLVITEDGKLVETKTDGVADAVAERVARGEEVLKGVKFSNPRNITNPYLPLSSTKQDILEGMEGGAKFRVERTAKPDLRKTFKVGEQIVETLVFEDRAYEDGKLIEVALDYFAQDDTGTVFYLGEDVDEYEDGKIIGHEGSWLYGKDTPAPGVIFAAKPAVGQKWRTEDVSDEIGEKNEIVSITETVKTPGGTFENCVKVKEDLADGTIEYKFYALGVGVVRELPYDGDVLLRSHKTLTATPSLDTTSRNETLLDAMSPFEDMAEAALAKNRKGVKESLAEAQSGAAEVLKALPRSEVKKYERLLKSIEDASTAKEHHSVAVNAVEMFRLLAESLDENNLDVPKEVSLLDYVGFRLHVLAAAKTTDWNAMQSTVAEGTKWWDAIKEKVDNKGLRDAFQSTISGLEQAIELKHLPMLNFAAQIDLDLVDLLESHFQN